MTTEQLKILDECLTRMKNGETVENCLASHSEIRELLKPLLETAANISAVPKASPSEDFRELSQARLMARLREESKSKPKKSAHEKSTSPWHGLWQGLSARPLVAVFLVIILVAGLCLTVLRGFISPTDTAHAAEYTLSILDGSAEVKSSDSTDWQPATSGLKLMAGTSIRTTEASHAVLTFMDGSTTKLEPNTDITVLKSEYKKKSSVRIGLVQQLGKTWNYLQGAGKTAPNFEIQTPAAKMVAHGTAFISEVDSTGLTTVAVFNGTVSVAAQEKQVSLTANSQTKVEPGMTPASPTPVPTVQDELVVVTNLPAVASVCDPSGSSTGNLPSGISYSQIASSSSLLTSNKQRIEVDEPAAGEYSIIVRNVSQDASPITIQMVHDGQTVSKEIAIPDSSGERDWIIQVKLTTALDSIANTQIVSIEPLKDKTPETIVETKLAKERATPIAVSTVNPDSSLNETATPHTPTTTNTISPKTPVDTDNAGTPQNNTPSPTEKPSDTSTADDNTGTIRTPQVATPIPPQEPTKILPTPAATSPVKDDTNTIKTPQVATPITTPEPIKITPTPAATSPVKDDTNIIKTPQVATPASTPEPTKIVPTPAPTSVTNDNTDTSNTPNNTNSDPVIPSPPITDTGSTGSSGSVSDNSGNTGVTATTK